MKKITKEEMFEDSDFYINEIKSGKIFIYPTDTVYGIGANAKFDESVIKIREIKRRDERPMLVIAPRIEWIYENCEILTDEHRRIIEHSLPGNTSFVLKMRKLENVSRLLVGKDNTLGVRIPRNWFRELIETSGVPFITTSTNYSGKPPATKISEIQESILEQVDYLVLEEDKELSGKPSKIVDLTEERERVLRE